MAKTAKGTKWQRISAYKRGNGTVRGHCRSTPNRRKR